MIISKNKEDGTGVVSRPCPSQEPHKERKNRMAMPSPTAEAACSVSQVTELIIVNKKLEDGVQPITCWGIEGEGLTEKLPFPLAPGSGCLYDSL